ncbi:MAG: cation:proton antiporter [Candidatus Aenigmatarchaeota archaeon]|nr:MAG: cation:proton antiporter [Candidatus Aenigmarchaeota archaeon]
MLVYVISMLMVGLGAYALMLKENLIKKMIGLGIMSNGIHLFLISVGYKIGGVAPILKQAGLEYLATHSVDPVPQALVMTSIVINISITAVALSLIIQAYRKTGTIEADKLRSLRG